MKFTEAQLQLLPTDEETALYKEQGYYLSRPLFTEEEIAQVSEATERFYAGEVSEPPYAIPEHFLPKGEYNGLRKHDYASCFCPPLRKLVLHPLIGAIAARLAETSEVRLWHDQLLYKPPQDPNRPSNVGWHTDRGYWKTCTSENMLTAWIPFHDCDEEMGGITMIEGSHKWPDNTEILDFFSSDLEGLEKRFTTGGKPVVKVPLAMRLGQVSFHNCLTIHGSGPNHTTSPRRSVAVHLQDEANRFQSYRYPNGHTAHHGVDEFCRKTEAGFPDYTDPMVFPKLYPQT